LDQEQKIYTFYINGVDPGAGIWGCLAASEDEAFRKAKKHGLQDFFLSNITDRPSESIRGNAIATLLSNPNLGPIWLPMAEAIELLESQLHGKSGVWVLNTLLESNNYSPNNSPYAQAILEPDGSCHVEVAGRLAIEDMSEEDLRLLDFIGWTVPDLVESELDREVGLPNPYKVFEVGWGALQIAAFVLETLITVYGFRETDYMEFTKPRTAEAIAAKGNLERVEIHPGNPHGTLFRLIQTSNLGA
jgi:hypothetical protein